MYRGEKRVYIEIFRRQFTPRTDKKMVDVLRMNLLFVEFIISLLPAYTTVLYQNLTV
jgi:hypothetical protein